MEPGAREPGHSQTAISEKPGLPPVFGAGAFVVGEAILLGIGGHLNAATWWPDGAALLAASGLLAYGLLRLSRRGRCPSIEEIPVAIWQLDSQGRIRRWNRQAEEIAGGDDGWVGLDFAKVAPVDFQAGLISALELARVDGAASINTRLRTIDGTSVPCRGRIARSSSGLSVALRNVSAENRELEQLRENRDNLQQMVEMSSHLTAIVAADHIAWINPAGARLLGAPEGASLNGRVWSDFMLSPTRLRRLDGGMVEVECTTIPTLHGGHAARIVEARDVTSLHLTSANLDDAERRLHSLMVVMDDAVVLLGADGMVRSLNESATRLLGYTLSEIRGLPASLLIAPAALAELAEEAKLALATGDPIAIHQREISIRRRDGSLLPVLLSVGESRDGADRLFTAVLRDQSEQHNLHARLSVSEKVLESTSEGVMVTARDGTILWVNGGFTRISGYPREEVIGHNASLLKSGLQGSAFYKTMWSELATKGEWAGEIWNRRKDGEAFPEWLTIKAVPNQSGRIDRYVGVFSDISKHKRAEETIRHLTYYDPVTRLPNRYLFQDRIGQALERARRTERKVALVLVSLDRFKTVNETLGHQVGDDLLREVAGRLVNSVRAEDTVSRLRGDTFCCVLLELSQTHDANPVINRILECFAQPFIIAGHELFITASLGISLFPMDAGDIDDLIQKAETAMNRSKERAENTYHFYTPEMNANSMERLRLETDLRKAIHRGELILHYQPKVETTTGRLLGAEALVRWRHPEYGLVPPGRFIPIAEDTGLILPIGAHVLREACDQVHVWRQMGLNTVRIAVNISAHQFRQPDLVDNIQHILEQADIPASMIELELTESAVMRNADAAVQVLTRLHDMGFEIAIDDFGTGYSSLSYLKRFPIDRLKIDRSFVQDLGANQAGEGIVGAIIAMAHNLKMAVIAEGVETTQQLGMLRNLDCDEIQGYYFSKPVPADEFADYMRAGVLTGKEV